LTINNSDIIGFTHKINITPRYCETDQMGVIYYGHYFDWFEVARTRLFNFLDLPYRKLEKFFIYLPVAEANARYISSAKYDIEVEIETRISEFKHGLVRFDYIVSENGKKLVTGFTKHIFMKDGKRFSISMEKLKELLENDN
jgi:acyl-CoA thioester hydrolase